MDRNALSYARGAHSFSEVPSDTDWTPSLFPLNSFDSVSHWSDFRDSDQLEVLLQKGLESDTSCEAVADITRAIDAMKLQKQYDDSQNRKVRKKILDHAPKTVNVLWDRRKMLQDDRESFRTNKRATRRVYMRKYIATILSICLTERPNEFSYLGPPALDLYYWLYLISISNQERDNCKCELPESVQKHCDMDKVWRSIAPKMLEDIGIVAFQNRLVAGMEQSGQPGPKRRLEDTCHILRCNPGLLPPETFRMAVRGAKTVFFDVMENGGGHNESFEVVGLLALCVSDCAKTRDPGFLYEVYADTESPLAPSIDPASPLHEILVMSAIPAIIDKKDEYLNLIRYTTTCVRGPQGSDIRDLLAKKMKNDTTLRRTYQQVEDFDQDPTRSPNALQIKKVLDELADALGLGHLLEGLRMNTSDTLLSGGADMAPTLPKLRGMFNKK